MKKNNYGFEIIDRMEKMVKDLARENALLKQHNESIKQRYEATIDEMNKSTSVIIDEYNRDLEDLKSNANDMKLAMQNLMLEKKNYEMQVKKLIKDIRKDKKNMQSVCSVCGEPIKDDYVYKNGVFICVHCWDQGID